MSNTNTGGPAFPSHGSMGEVAQEGMTLRDYFAAKAVIGVLAQLDVCDGREHANAAWIAYQIADAMLKAREA